MRREEGEALLYPLAVVLGYARPGSISPYAPTPQEVTRLLPLVASVVSRGGYRVAVDLGCGTGVVAAVLAQGGYTVCLELDEELAARARESLEGVVADVVVGDALTPPLRRANLCYAYLTQDYLDQVVEAGMGLGCTLLVLDHSAPWNDPLAVVVVTVDGHQLVVYTPPGRVYEK